MFLQKSKILILFFAILLFVGFFFAIPSEAEDGPAFFSISLDGQVSQLADDDNQVYYHVEGVLYINSVLDTPTSFDVYFGSSPGQLDTKVLSITDAILPFTFSFDVTEDLVGPLVPGQEYYTTIQTVDGTLFGVQNLGKYRTNQWAAVAWDQNLVQAASNTSDSPYFFNLSGRIVVANQLQNTITLKFGDVVNGLVPVAQYDPSYGNDFVFIQPIGGTEYESLDTGETLTIQPNRLYYAAVYNGSTEISRILAGSIDDGFQCVQSSEQWYFFEDSTLEALSGPYETEQECVNISANLPEATACSLQTFQQNICDESGVPDPSVIIGGVGPGQLVGPGSPIATGTPVASGTPIGPGEFQLGNYGPNTLQGTSSSSGTSPSSSYSSSGGLVPCDGVGDEACDYNQFIKLVNNAIKYIFILILPIAAIAFSYAGFLYLSGGSNMETRKKARRVFMKVLTGIVVILAAWLIVATLLKSLGVKKSTNPDDPGYILLDL